MSTDKSEVKYDFEPWDGTPGDPYDKYEKRLLNYGSRSDDRGWSLSDHLLGNDEGGPTGPAIPGGAAGVKAQAALRKRQKESYGIQTRHILRATITDELSRSHFQMGRAAFLAVRATGQVAVDRLRLDELDDDWKSISIIHDIGVNESTIQQLAQKIRAVNSERPAASQKDETEQTERFLECLFKASKHFSEGALIEYQSPAGSRTFEHPPPIGGGVQHRDFAACEAHYAPLWRNAVRSKLPGFHKRDAQTRPSPSTRQTLEQGLMGRVGREAPSTRFDTHDLANAADDSYVPRSGSPSETLFILAEAGDELSSRRGTLTTTDWSLCSVDELALLANCGSCEGGECAYLFDADDQGSAELLCDCCGGAGHLKRVCPSPRNRSRSHAYIVALHQSKMQQRDARGPMRRVPGRGQRAPFRAFSRRLGPRNQPTRRPPFPGNNPRARSAEEGGSETESDWQLQSLELPPGLDASTTSSSSRGSSSVVDSATRASDERSAIAQVKNSSFAFETSDDALFEHGHVAAENLSSVSEHEPEHGHAGVEDGPTVTLTRPSPVILTAACSVILTAILTTLEFISRNVGCVLRSPASFSSHLHRAGAYRMSSTSTLLRIAIIILIVGFTPYGRGHSEHALIGGEHAYISSGTAGLEVCVDSGCTTTSIPEEIASLFPCKKLLEEKPNRSLYIADNKGLPILRVMSTELPAEGFSIDDAREMPAPTVMPISRALVVRGMKPSMILLSVRGLKRDNINTYLNDDNSISRSDCLYMVENKTVIPFVQSTHSYNISVRVPNESAKTAHSSSTRTAAEIHSALSHVGKRRARESNLSIDGVMLKDTLGPETSHDEASCKGCRLGNTGKLFSKHKRSQLSRHGDATRGFDHFGQQMDSDICTGFPPSFPHLFTCMVNYIDRWGHESYLYFMRSPSAQEVSSSAQTLQDTIKHRLVDGKIGRWVTDNGKQFLGEETENLARELCRDRGFQIPHDSDTLPVPERNWGVLERMIRSDLSHAEANQCLWPWGAAQANLLLYYLPTSALQPPKSPFEFTTGNSGPVDISWARTMYCDCTVSIPARDRNGKLGNRGADACNLGYDPRRGGHFCYVPSLQRISTFTVSEWRDESFTLCKTITADTPVEYIDARDLSIAPVTASMVPRRYSARAGAEIPPLDVVFLFGGTDEENTTPSILREWGHTATVYDTAMSISQDLAKTDVQDKVLQHIRKADFVFLSPPCDTASIAHNPALRTVDEPKGRSDLSPIERTKVEKANVLYDFSGVAIQACEDNGKRWALESAASRRVGPPKCKWSKYEKNGFLWDYPAITRFSGHAVYHTFAQCAFDAPWQKYTGLLTDVASAPVAKRVFGHAHCSCLSHKIVLQGYDEAGVARTRQAQRYWPRLAHAFATFIVESCGSNQEGERGDQWSDALRAMNRSDLCLTICNSVTEGNHHRHDIRIGKPLLPTNPAPKPIVQTTNQRRAATAEQEIELWMESAEGAYRVSEIGNVPVPKSVEEARESKWWPLFSAAMEEEVFGKLSNNAFSIVKRPQGKHVLKSKWVFTVKYNDDGSIKVVKARFVACGYSQVENSDYDKVFATNLDSVGFRSLICMIADEDLETDHTDAYKAFTQSGVDHLIYVEMPELFGLAGYVLLLHKALEGIKQGAYLWFQHNRAAWIRLGATSCIIQPNLYRLPDIGTRIGVFADDTLSGYPKRYEANYRALKAEYGKLIKIDSVELSPLVKFTGCQVVRDREHGTITVHMERYIIQLCEEYKGQFTPRDMPYNDSEKERRAFDQMEDIGEKADKGPFLQLMGKLVWPSSMVRLDISTAVCKLCTKVQAPYQNHHARALDVIGYLSTTKRLGITYGGRTRTPIGLKEPPPGFVESAGLYIAHDNSFGSVPRPMGGFVIMYCNGAIDWSAGNLKLVPDSTHEAESAQASRAAKAGIYVRQLLVNNGRKVVGPTTCIGDNKANQTSSQQIGSTARTRYYERAVLLFKRAVLLLILSPYRVDTSDMIADIFTKATPRSTFVKMRNIMMNVHGSFRTSLEESYAASTGTLRRLLGSVHDALNSRS